MNTTLYLVTTLIVQYDEPVIATHSLYTNFADAKLTMQKEIMENMKDFTACNGDVILDLNNIYEWSDYNCLNSLTVIIERLTVN